MNGMLRVRRSRGVLSGLLLVLLGIWGALIPFVGPYFHYAYTPDKAWTYTTGRLWLELLPGAATVLGGLIVLASAYRPSAHFGAWLAALSGAWFALGGLIGPTWIGMHMTSGTPVGGTATRALEQIGFFTGLGLVIVLLAAMAVGRFSVISVGDARRASRAERRAERAAAAEDAASTERAASTDDAASTEPADDAPASGGSWRDRLVLRRRVTTDETDTDEPVTETATATKS
jgi:hypothetical protein